MNLTRTRVPVFLVAFAALLVLSLSSVGCSGGNPDPKYAYDSLKAAAIRGNGLAVYDLLDSALRAKQDEGIQMQAQQRESLPPEEKVKWDTISKYKGREAFAKMFQLNKEQLITRFKGDHTILRVDTIYALTIQNKETNKADVMLFRWYNGRYAYSTMPEPPQSATPPQSMPPQESPHGGGAQAPPNGSAPPSGAPPSGAAPNTAPETSTKPNANPEPTPKSKAPANENPSK